MGLTAWDLKGMANITSACNEGAAQTVAVLSIMPRSGGGPGAADCKIAVEPALGFAHRTGWCVCLLKAEDVTLGRVWRPIGEIHENIFADGSEVGDVLDKDVEVLDSSGRASCPVEC